MAKIYSTDGKILTGDNFPQLQIKDKLYPVDNRQSTYMKINKAIENKEGDDAILKLALGEKGYKDVIEMDLRVPEYKNLIIFIMAAIEEVEFEEVEKRFQKQQSE